MRDPDDLDACTAAFTAIDADPREALLVAEPDGAVVGTMQLTTLRRLSRRGSSRLQVEAVRVRSDVRSRGIGRAMLRAAVAEACRQGCTLVQLTSRTVRTDAHRFYRSLGFTGSHTGFTLDLTEGPG